MLGALRTAGIELIKQIIRPTPLYPLAKSTYNRYRNIVDKRHPIQDTETSEEYSLARLGTEYGGWTFVDEPELNNSVIISAGLGEDASFDVEFAQQYNSKVIIVDPTPRAIHHFEKLKNSLGTEKTKSYTQSGKQPVEAYDLSKVDKSQLVFVEKALWDEQTEIEFYKPEIESHVSHSIVNWQHDYDDDTDYIEVKADTITSIINNQGISGNDIPLIKLDIEGAEIEVIKYMIDSGLTPKQILVEFDELHNPSDKAFERVDKAHNLLLKNGYELIYSDGTADFLYYKEDI